MNKARYITTAALMTAVSLTVFLIELQLPPPAPIPGIKYGLANVVTLYILYGRVGGVRMAAMVLTARVVLALLLTGRGSAIFMSICGGGAALAVTAAVYALLRLRRARYAVAAGVAGGIAHNTGQLAAAVFVYGLRSAVAYAPYLAAGGAAAGLFTGAVVAAVAGRTIFRK